LNCLKMKIRSIYRQCLEPDVFIICLDKCLQHCLAEPYVSLDIAGNGRGSSLSGVYVVDCMCELRARVCVLF
jgi:hypothetical protein